MAIPRMRTVYEAYKMIRKEDPDTALTYYSIRRFVEKKEIRKVYTGKKYLINYDDLVEMLGGTRDDADPDGSTFKAL